MDEYKHAKTLDGDHITLYPHDEEEGVARTLGLESFGYYITFAFDAPEWAEKLFEALQHVRVADMD